MQPTITLAYDSEHGRIIQTAPSGTTTYLNDTASSAMSEKLVSGSTTTWHDYIQADGHIVAERFNTGGTITTSYFELDHIGSVAVVTDNTRAVVERDSYDAWGRRRNPNGTDNAPCSIVSQTTRGFTNQEEMDAVCLVNMNARIYDPTIARFMTVDPVTATPYDMQSLNRYTYVDNRPLDLTDPTGEFAQAQVWPDGTVHITIPIQFNSQSADPEATSSAISNIQSKWTGQFGKYNVTTTVESVSAAENAKCGCANTVTITDTPAPPTTTPGGTTVSNGGHSYVVGDYDGHWTTKDTKGTPMPTSNTNGDMGVAAKKEDTDAHEAGHLMGLPDEKGQDKGNLMDDGSGRNVTEGYIKNIVDAPGNQVAHCSDTASGASCH